MGGTAPVLDVAETGKMESGRVLILFDRAGKNLLLEQRIYGEACLPQQKTIMVLMMYNDQRSLAYA